MKFAKLLMVVTAMLFMTLPFAAMAAEAVLYPINIQQPVQGLVGYLFGALSAGVLFILNRFVGPGKKVPLDQQTRTLLEVSIQGALRMAEQKVLVLCQDIRDPAVKSEVIATATNYVLSCLPQIAAQSKLTRDTVQAMVTSRLNTSFSIADTIHLSNGPVVAP